MTRLLLSLAFLFIAIGPATGQGTIRGKMTDAQTGETLIGANVVIKEPYKGAMADIDGNYELDGLSPGTYMVTGSFIGYTPITETVEVGEGVTILNFNLYVETFVIEQAAEVVAKVDRSRDVYMENIKKKSASSMDFISSQQIKQTGDSDAAGAIKRVPGVSTVGNFVFVRGLSDRYIKTTLNGAEVPSMNPRRNSIEMDLFPTNLVDNLMIVKTQTADLPGDWAGAYISIETKDFPEEFTLNYSTTVGFNDQTTFRNVLASNRGETDWMAFDDGQRGIPNYAQGLTQEDWPYQQSASFYDALIYLNFGSQLDTLYGGISQGGIGPGVGQVPIQEILSDLDYSDTSLVNLGGADGTYLLNQEGLIPVAELLNDSLTQLGQSFNNTWAVRQKQAPLNFSHSLSLGSQTKLFGRPLGYIFGLRWGQSSQHYENGEYGRYAGGSIEGTDSLGLERYYDDTRSDISHKWNALANLSYKVNEFNKISLMAMPNMSATASTRQQVGFNPRDTEEFQQQITHRYEGRELNIFQLRGEHFLPASETEIRWTASHSAGRLNTPDLRVFFNNFDTATVVTSTAFQGLDTTYTEDVMLDQINYLIGEGILGEDWANDPQGTVEELNAYWEDEGEDFSLERIDLETELDTSYSIQQSLYPSPTRYYRDLYENRTDVKLHVLQPLNLNGFDDVKLSGGVSLVRTTRSMQENQFGFEATSANFLDAFDGDLDAYFADSNFVANPSAQGDYITTTLLTDLINTDDASLDVWGAYGMFNFRKNDRFSGNFGARVEAADMFIRSRKIDLVDDLNDEQIANLQGGLNEVNVMPSVNMTYVLGELDPIKLTNLRLSYSKTIARPVFREKAPFRSFNFEWLEVLKGNPELDETKIDNFDLRLEHFPGLGEVVSASVFYKRFTDPIEQTSVLAAVNTEYTWSNVPFANVWGLELEGRKSLGSISPALQGFGVSGNLTLIKSEARIWEDELRAIRGTDPLHPETRPLFGQSPYIINAMLTYNHDKEMPAYVSRTNAALSFNLQGEKLLLVTEGGAPDIYQQPTPTLDFSFSQSLSEGLNLRLRARNLLNPEDRKTYMFNDVSYNWLANTRGRTYSITLSYNI